MRRRRAARWRGRRRRRERWRNRRRRTRARRGRAPPTARRGVRSRVCWAQARRQRVRGDSRQTVAPVRPPRARLQHDPRLRVVLRSGVLRLRCTPPSRERCPCPRRAVLPHLAAQVERRMAAAAVSRRENKKYFLTSTWLPLAAKRGSLGRRKEPRVRHTKRRGPFNARQRRLGKKCQRSWYVSSYRAYYYAL